MPTNSKTCYDKNQLAEYLHERLAESEEQQVHEHLGTCEKCQRELERIAAEESVWQSLREHLTLAPEEAESYEAEVDRRMQRLVEYLAPTDDPNSLGRLGSYEVCGIVGQGSTGIVLKALETRLNRYVAIKVMSPMFSSSGAARRRFERESRAVAAVSHEHVVPIYAVDEYRGLPYIVMQYIPGQSLHQRIEKEGALETHEVARIGLQVASGLAAAHAQGIVHRDVKPANVILENSVDRAMVTDFGLARVADEATMTRSGTIAGTPQFMSPEQAQGETVDSRSDLFSLGSLMYIAATGRPAFRADSVFGVISRVCESKPRDIREINPDVEEWLAVLIKRLMRKKPEDRFQAASEVQSALAHELAFMQNPASSAQPKRDWWIEPAEELPPADLNPWRKMVGAVSWAVVAVGAGVLGLSLSPWASDLGLRSPVAIFEPQEEPQQQPQRNQDDPDDKVSSEVASPPSAENTAQEQKIESQSGPVAEDDSPESPQKQAENPTAPTDGSQDAVAEGEGEGSPNAQAEDGAPPTVVVGSSGGSGPSESGFPNEPAELEEPRMPLEITGSLTWKEQEADKYDGEIVHKYQSRFEFELPLEEAKRVTFKLPRGSVEVRQTELENVSIVLYRDVSAASEKEAEKILGYHQLEGARDSNTFYIEEKLDEAFLQRGGSKKFARVFYAVNLPIGAALDLETEEGSVAVGALRGDVRLSAKGAKGIGLGRIDGSVFARSEGGSVRAQQGSTGDLDVMTTVGHVFVANVDGKCRVRSSGGSVHLGPCSGEVYSQVSGGDIFVSGIEGPFGAHSEHGNIYLDLRSALVENSTVTATDGSVSVALFEQVPIRIEASGHVESPLEFVSEKVSRGDTVRDLSVWQNADSAKVLDARSTTGLVFVTQTGLPPEYSAGLGGSGGGGMGGSYSYSHQQAAVKGLASPNISGGGGMGMGFGMSLTPEKILEKTSGEPRPGAIVPVELDNESAMDGYTIYLPPSYATRSGKIPVIVYLQGAYGVGGEIGNVSKWGLPRLLRDESDLGTERNKLLLDSFIVVSPHIQEGQYFEHPQVVQGILDEVFEKYSGDPKRVYLTGLSRGGHGSWGLPQRMPGVFAAVAPVAGDAEDASDLSELSEVAIWISHNQGDRSAGFAEAEIAASKIEQKSGSEFHRVLTPVPEDDEYLSHKYVFTQPELYSHDAWTDFYSSAQFYKWLLKQSR